jgi:hypothetical protein
VALFISNCLHFDFTFLILKIQHFVTIFIGNLSLAECIYFSFDKFNMDQ